jgi:Rps23 Pro-64 3,4-dihydroxylase Tpa1-like proline 4-hydroxylase
LEFLLNNVLLFLNKDWLPEWNGNLELWSKDRSEKVVDILPDFNRMVIFNTDDESYHGCPTPLECPEDRFRLSLATYYYVYEENLDESQQRLNSEFYD